MRSDPITVLTYHRNGEITECQFRNMRDAQEYMDIAIKNRNVAECEYYA